jgi:hypothetical protein
MGEGIIKDVVSRIGGDGKLDTVEFLILFVPWQDEVQRCDRALGVGGGVAL